MSFIRSSLIVCFALLPLAPCSSHSEELVGKEYEQDQVDRWHDYYLRTAKAYRIVADESPEEPLQLVDAPLLTYTDLESFAQQHGSVFVWCRDGHPVVLSIFWSATWGGVDRRVAHEFQSLTDEPLSASIKGQKNWNPRTSGLDFRPLPGGPEVASTKPLRTAQLRRLAADFAAFHTRDGNENKLKRVADPVYRYPESEDSDNDGAIFLYFFEQDPEVGLQFETVETDGKLYWNYFPIQLTEVAARMTYKGEEVWNVPKRRFTANFLEEETDPYHALFYERRDRLMEDEKSDESPAE
jgi:hypothetical protein